MSVYCLGVQPLCLRYHTSFNVHTAHVNLPLQAALQIHMRALRLAFQILLQKIVTRSSVLWHQQDEERES